MKKRISTVLAGLALVALGVAGCSEDPALFLSGPPGPVVEIQFNAGRLDLRAGESATLGVQPRDAAGNAVGQAATIAACNAKVSVAEAGSNEQWGQLATVTASDMGESCLTVSAGGVTDTVVVRLAPGSILITGPDTVLSGQSVPAAFGVEFYSTDGTQLTAGADFEIPEVVSTNSLRLPITAASALTYDAAGQQPGTAVLEIETVRQTGEAVTANKAVTIVPGIFGGTLSANTAAQGGQIDITTALTLDGDEFVTIGGIMASNWTGVMGDPQFLGSGTSLSFLVPYTLAPGDYELIINNQGPFQVAEATTVPFTVTAGTPTVNQQNPRIGNFMPQATLEDKINGLRSSGVTVSGRPPLAFPVVWDPVTFGQTTSYYTYNNCGQGWAGPGSGSGCSSSDGGAAAETAIRVTLDWIDSCGPIAPSSFGRKSRTCDEDAGNPSIDEDFDVQFIDGGFTAFLDTDGGTLSKPETSLFNFNDGNFYFVRFQTFSGDGAAHVVIEALGNGGICSDEDGCTIGGEI